MPPLLGRGNRAHVYHCERKGVGQVATKMTTYRQHAETGAPLEFVLLTKVQGHPNVVRLLGCDLGENSTMMLHMELVPGGCTIRDLIEDGQTEWCTAADVRVDHGVVLLGEYNVWSLWRKVATALAHCHAMGIAHRDVKADNVLVVQTVETIDPTQPLADQLDVRLCDFDLASQFEGNQRVDSYPGTLEYAAPEIVAGVPHEPAKADVWALGVMLYVMFKCSYPFGNDKARTRCYIMHGRWDFDRHEDRPVPEGARQLMERMLTTFWPARPSIAEVLTHPWVTHNPSVVK